MTPSYSSPRVTLAASAVILAAVVLSACGGSSHPTPVAAVPSPTQPDVAAQRLASSQQRLVALTQTYDQLTHELAVAHAQDAKLALSPDPAQPPDTPLPTATTIADTQLAILHLQTINQELRVDIDAEEARLDQAEQVATVPLTGPLPTTPTPTPTHTTPPPPPHHHHTTTTTHATPVATPGPPHPHPLLSAADLASFARLSASLGGANGVAVSAVGRNQRRYVTGSLRTGVAWSSIKPAIAVATEQRAGGQVSASTQSLLTRAITASDNAAAQSLWDALGGGTQSAHTVQQVLASAGDTDTHVQPSVTRPGFTAFGQTVWPLSHQLRFVAALPCLPDSAPVLNLMDNVIASQRWGLGSAGRHAAFKGGWGPSPSGAYLVRQMGLMRFGSRELAVAIATVPANGDFGSGTQNLTAIAQWVAQHVDPTSLPRSPQC